jgi:hypothetical protein
MSGPPSLSDGPSPISGTKKRRRRDVPLWVPIVAVMAASPFISAGVFAIAEYVTAHTTVTIDLVSWAVTVDGGTEYIITCQTSGSFGPCPHQVKPGSEYASSIYISGYFAGKNVSLSAPSPFQLKSTNPGLPAPVPLSGLTIAVNLTLPSSPGEYSFTGEVIFS